MGAGGAGEELGQNAQDIVSLTVAGVPCGNVTYVSISEVRCVTRPAESPRTDNVYISTLSSGDIEDASSTVPFTYNQPPTTQSVSPATGPETGGSLLSIVGQALGQSAEDVVEVLVAGTSCRASLVYVNSSALQCTLPPKPPVVTTNLVVVTTLSGGDGTATAAARFEYTATPVVTGIYPTQGATSGYTVVRVTGTGFGASADDVLDLLVAGVSCRFSLIYESPESLSCFTGAASEYAAPPQPQPPPSTYRPNRVCVGARALCVCVCGSWQAAGRQHYCDHGDGRRGPLARRLYLHHRCGVVWGGWARDRH
jgi:hypothetical protein